MYLCISAPDMVLGPNCPCFQSTDISQNLFVRLIKVIVRNWGSHDVNVDVVVCAQTVGPTIRVSSHVEVDYICAHGWSNRLQGAITRRGSHDVNVDVAVGAQTEGPTIRVPSKLCAYD